MKEKILIFIIGLLGGAVIASGAFLVYTKVSDNSNNTQISQPDGQPPEMNNNGGTPPEKPSDDTKQNNQPDNQQNDQTSN